MSLLSTYEQIDNIKRRSSHKASKKGGIWGKDYLNTEYQKNN